MIAPAPASVLIVAYSGTALHQHHLVVDIDHVKGERLGVMRNGAIRASISLPPRDGVMGVMETVMFKGEPGGVDGAKRAIEVAAN